MPRNPSPAQSAASRRNGARSRGPVTPEGRAASLAGLGRRSRHGLLARAVVLPGESPARFAELCDQLFVAHRPQSLTEHLMVEHLAAAAWRLRRAQAPEPGFLPADRAAVLQGPLRSALRYQAAQFDIFTRTRRALLALQRCPPGRHGGGA